MRAVLQNTGTVFVENTAPINAPLEQVTVTLRKAGEVAVVVEATCPTLTVPAGGRINCTYVARCGLLGQPAGLS